jgi:hypothetical protein
MGQLLTLRSTIARPADNTAYQAGDEISNSATAGSVVRATFNLSGFDYGRIHAAQLDVTATSGNVVTTASGMELLIFKTANVPAAVGDNVTHPIAAATKALAVGAFVFDDTGWTGPLGTVAAGTSQISKVPANVVIPTTTPAFYAQHHPGFFFEFKQGEARTLTAVMRVLAAWTPTGVINTFGIKLDIEVE